MKLVDVANQYFAYTLRSVYLQVNNNEMITCLFAGCISCLWHGVRFAKRVQNKKTLINRLIYHLKSSEQMEGQTNSGMIKGTFQFVKWI